MPSARSGMPHVPATFVLIHGAWGGAWCWERKLAPLLREMGHAVLAPDLPAHGDDPTPPVAVGPTAYAESVAALLAAQHDAVVLVGHSMGGTVISQAAEWQPSKVRKLVYVAAYLAPSGYSLADMLKSDAETLLRGNIILSEDRRSSMIRDEVVRDALYGECSEEDFAFARSRLRPESAAPSRTPLKLTEENFGRIPRAYIECLHDRTISLNFQRAMQIQIPCAELACLDTDHSPFFSRPDDLAKILSTFGLPRQ